MPEIVSLNVTDFSSANNHAWLAAVARCTFTVRFEAAPGRRCVRRPDAPSVIVVLAAVCAFVPQSVALGGRFVRTSPARARSAEFVTAVASCSFAKSMTATASSPGTVPPSQFSPTERSVDTAPVNVATRPARAPDTRAHAHTAATVIFTFLWSRAFRLGFSDAGAPSSNRACGFPAHGFPCETGVIGISFL